METISIPFDKFSAEKGLIKRTQKEYALVRVLNNYCDKLK